MKCFASSPPLCEDSVYVNLAEQGLPSRERDLCLVG